MSLASRHTKIIDLPHDPPHTVTIQKLPGRHFYEADRQNDYAAQEYVSKMGGAEFRQQLADALKGQNADEAIKKVQRDPVNMFDKFVVLKAGLKAWSFTEADGTPIPVTPENIEDLDPETVEYVAREILRYTKPSLFMTPEEAKAEQKND